MRGAGRSAGDRGGRLRRGLVAAQIALSLVLVSAAGLLARSLLKLEAQDFGFERTSRVIVDLAPSLQSIPREKLPALYAMMQERLLRVPGISNAAFSLYSPMSGDNWSGGISVEGHGTGERLTASWNRITPRYFETIGTPILRGRGFTTADTPDAPTVAVVSMTFARTFFGNTDPIGRHIGFGADPAGQILEIVGIVGDAKYQDGREAQRAMFYVPFLQRSRRSSADSASAQDRSQYPGAIELVATGSARGLEGQIRSALAEVDRRISVDDVTTIDEQIARQFAGDNLLARLTATFGFVALLLACLGLYGVTAYSVTRRTREIGIRMAIGATHAEVLRSIVRTALVQLAIGLAIGLPADVAVARLLRAQLFGIDVYDPVSFGGSIAVLGMASLLASLIPALRAAAMDPARALRVE